MDENIQEQELSAQQLSELLQIRRDKLDALREAGKDPFEITKYDVTAYSGDIKANFVDPPEGEESTTVVSIAGRIMSKRGMGKASFADLQDKHVFSFMSARIWSATTPMQTLKSGISAILSALPALFSAPIWEKSP